MNGFLRHTRALWPLAVLLLAAGGWASCQGVIDGDGEICAYTVQLRYDYNEENTTQTNEFAKHVLSTEEYIFDEHGILCAIGPVTADACTGEWVTQQMLPPGRYSVIAVGNRTSMSSSGPQPKVGETRREDLLLTLVNRSANGTDDGVHFESCGRLFHGYRTFTVAERGISHIRVDMVHSHLDLRFTIRWKNNQIPAHADDFYVLLKDVPSQYHLMPEFLYPVPREAAKLHDPVADDKHESVSDRVIHHIPQVHHDRNLATHRKDVGLYGNALSAQMIGYRIRNVGADRAETTISLYGNGGTQLMKDIHLNDFLNRSGINLDHTLKQQYHIVFEINPDTGEVTVWFADIADWDEGGNLGG